MENLATKAYSEILKVLKKHKDVCIFDIADLEKRSKYHLFGIKLKEEYNFNLDPKQIQSLDWIRFDEYMAIGRWGKSTGTISWPDDGRQPEDELLLQINFPTGPYIFGGDYPTDFFYKFFLELKGFKPKYIDSANKALYFSMDNAGIIFNEFGSILKKYNDLNAADIKQRKIKKMKDDLEKLEKS